jgi:microcompartment protein CcmK/EutM
MITAKVVGNIWATRKHASLEGKKLLLIKQYDEEKKDFCGATQMAIDGGVSAGIGDSVLIIDEGSSCRQILGTQKGPTRTIIVGIIDSVNGRLL